MKKIYILSLSLFCFLFYAHAQNATMGINYQGVARSQTGVPLPNTKLDIKLHINDSIPSKSKKRVYGEFFNVTTNSMGLYTLVIGTGSPLISVFGKIDWTQGIKNLEVEIQPNGASSYIYVGEFPLQFVPYALFAEHVRHELKPGNGIAITNDTIYNTGSTPQINLTNGGGILITGASPNYTITAQDSSNTNELQMLSLSNDTLYLSNGNYVLMNIYKDNTDSQKLNKNGNNISLSYGGSIILNDDDSANELQQISKTNKNISLDKNGGTITLNDDDSTNELQALSISNDTLFLSQGNFIYLGGYKDNTDNQNLSLANDTLSISNGNNVSLGKYLDNTDSQNISLANDTLTITNGNSVTLNKYLDNTDNQTLNKTGNNISLTSGGNVTLNDDDSTNEIQQLNKTNNTISLNKNGGNVVLNDDDSVNEIQQLNKTNNTISLNKNGGNVVLNDDDSANELQQVSLSNDTLFLSKNGGFVVLPKIQTTTNVGHRIISGAVDNSGSVIRGKGFSASRSGSIFTVTFNDSFLKVPIATATISGVGNGNNSETFICLINSISRTEVKFMIGVTNNSGSDGYFKSLSSYGFLSELNFVVTSDSQNTSSTYSSFVVNDDDSTNELQGISKTGKQISLDKNGGNVVLNDDDSTNELQKLSISNDTLKLSNGGGSVNINNFPLPSDTSHAVNAKAAIVNYLSFGSTTSNNNIYSINLPITPPAYQAGMMITFMADSANTDSVSINVNGLGIKRLKKLVTNELAANDILMGQMVIVVYDGKSFQMMSTPANTLKSPADNKTLIYTTDGF